MFKVVKILFRAALGQLNEGYGLVSHAQKVSQHHKSVSPSHVYEDVRRGEPE